MAVSTARTPRLSRTRNVLDKHGRLAILSRQLDRRLRRSVLGALDLRALRSPYQISGEQQCSPDFFFDC